MDMNYNLLPKINIILLLSVIIASCDGSHISRKSSSAHHTRDERLSPRRLVDEGVETGSSSRPIGKESLANTNSQSGDAHENTQLKLDLEIREAFCKDYARSNQSSYSLHGKFSGYERAKIYKNCMGSSSTLISEYELQVKERERQTRLRREAEIRLEQERQARLESLSADTENIFR